MIKPEDLPNFSHILALWREAWDTTQSQDFDPQIFKHVSEIKHYCDINALFKELLAEVVNKNIGD